MLWTDVADLYARALRRVPETIDGHAPLSAATGRLPGDVGDRSSAAQPAAERGRQGSQ
jgi:hypothetical protein